MRIVLVDDHRVVRDGIRYMLSDEEAIEIVADVGSGAELFELLEAEPVDIVLLDVRMPDMSGFDVLEQMRGKIPQVRVIMLSMHDAPGYVRRAVELGAAGYLLKNASRSEVLAALQSVGDGGAYIQTDLANPLVAELAGIGDSARSLSPREQQVLQLVAHGYENKQIGSELGISEATVKTYLRGIFGTLEVAGRAEAVAVGLRRGLIE
jgi:DNA-binding NarL/FixJ family response regulator